MINLNVLLYTSNFNSSKTNFYIYTVFLIFTLLPHLNFGWNPWASFKIPVLQDRRTQNSLKKNFSIGRQKAELTSYGVKNTFFSLVKLHFIYSFHCNKYWERLSSSNMHCKCTKQKYKTIKIWLSLDSDMRTIIGNTLKPNAVSQTDK